MELNGKVVLITGAKGGLGSYVTRAFLQAGARVAGVSRSIKDDDFPGGGFHAFPAELTSAGQAQALAESVTQRFGRIDAAVHLLGGYAAGAPVAETDDATFEQMFALNLRSLFHLLRAVLPGMRAQGGGRVLAIGSLAALDPQPGAGAYSAAKAALVSLMRAVAKENRAAGVTANVILPGAMDTPANRAAMPDTDPSQWVRPEQVAQLLVYLTRDESSQLSGAVIPFAGADL